MYGLVNSDTLYESFMNDPIFGHQHDRDNEAAKRAGCLACFWSMNFDNHFKDWDYSDVSINSGFGNFQFETVCLYADKNASCPDLINGLKRKIDSTDLVKVSEMQYANSPSCDYTDFGVKYWGDNYPRLLKLKAKYDPDNVFSHCQSVGSTEQDCCHYKIKKDK